MNNKFGQLFLIATPIGNLEDITFRAARILKLADNIFAEDTRHSRVLLNHLGIGRKAESLHDHNEQSRTPVVLELLNAGKSVAIITDAGTPGISDPGTTVVAAALLAGYKVSPIPGASALACALSVSGFELSSNGLLFLGFLEVKGPRRKTQLNSLHNHQGVAAFFEAPHRIKRTLEELALLDAERPICVCRELTKLYEEICRGTTTELAAWAQNEVRGELTVVLGPKTETAAASATDDLSKIDAALTRCFEQGLSARDASKAVAAIFEISKRLVYERAVNLNPKSTLP